MAILGGGGDVSFSITSDYNSRGVDSSERSLEKLEKSTKRTTDKMRSQYNRVSKSIFSIRSALVALGAFRLGRAIFTAAADLEDGFIRVAKTTGLAGVEMKLFEKQIGSLSTTMKGVTIDELVSIAAIAGQLGLKGREDLLRFTEVVAKMAVATNLTAEQAAEAFAQINNVLHEPIANMERMGSVMNELSNNSVATSSDIANLTLRMGGAAETLGLTTPEVLALSATLRDLGVSLEVGGSAVSKVLLKMLTDTKKFAEASGLTMQEYSRLLKESPVAALQTLLKKLSELDKFKEAAAIKSLGLGAIRTSGTIFKLTGGIDKLKENLERANIEWAKGTSLQIEYESASRRTRAELIRLNNKLKLNAKIIGEELLPAVVKVVGWISTAVEDFVRFGEVIGETAAKISLFTNTGGIFGAALRTDLERLGDMRLQMVTLTEAVRQNNEVIRQRRLEGNIDQVDLFTLANKKLNKEIFRLSIGIGLEEQAYIRAHTEIQKNTKGIKDNTNAIKDNADAQGEANGMVQQSAEARQKIASILETMTRKLLVNKGVKKEILALDVLAFQQKGATAEQLVQFIALDKKLIAVQQKRIEMGRMLGAMITGKVLIEAQKELVKVQEKQAQTTLSQAEADLHRQKTAQDLLALDVLAFQQGGASADQLIRLIGIKREIIAVEEAAIEQKRRQTELFARAQALNDLRNLQDNSPLRQAPDNEIARLKFEQDQKLAMIADHNALVIQAQINAGFAIDTIQATFAQQERDRDKQTAAFRLQTAAGAFGAAANFMQNLTVIAGSEGGAMFETMKGLASAQALIDTYAAAQGAYKSLVGIPIVGPALAVAAAAAATVAGLARVAQIQRTQPGATSGSSIGGGGVTNPGFTGGGNNAGPPPIPVTQITPPQPITIIINNSHDIETTMKRIEGEVAAGARFDIQQVG